MGCGPSLIRLPPIPPGASEGCWADIPHHGSSAFEIVEALLEAGYPQVVSKRLDGDLEGVAVVKAFVPGLGSLTRTRAR